MAVGRLLAWITQAPSMDSIHALFGKLLQERLVLNKQ
jgi:hypothetical protein